MKKISGIIDKVEDSIGLVCYVTMFIVVLIQVFFRFVLHNALSWTEEVARYLMIWMICVGISAGVKSRAHIGIEAIVDRLPKKVSRVMAFVIDIVVLLIYICTAVFSVQMVISTYESQQLTPSTRIPMYWIYMALPLGFILSSFRQVLHVLSFLFERKAEKEVDG